MLQSFPQGLSLSVCQVAGARTWSRVGVLVEVDYLENMRSCYLTFHTMGFVPFLVIHTPTRCGLPEVYVSPPSRFGARVTALAVGRRFDTVCVPESYKPLKTLTAGDVVSWTAC